MTSGPIRRAGRPGSSGPSGRCRGAWAFRVDDDLRVLFRGDGDICFLAALGTHDEVY